MEQAVILYPAPVEYGLHREQYDALVTDLRAEGLRVDVEPPTEERGIPGGVGPAEVYGLVIRAGKLAAAGITIDRVIAIVRGRLRGRERSEPEQRRGMIYLSDGTEHEFIYRDEDEHP